MSSRAIRRAQREAEEKKRLEKLENEESDVDDESPRRGPAPGMFAMLNATDDNGDEEDDDDTVEPRGAASEEVEEGVHTLATTNSTQKRRKAKKKRKPSPAPADPELDDIDRALRALDTEDLETRLSTDEPVDAAFRQMCTLLSIDSPHLHVSNEMRRLFGRTALEDDHADDDGGRGGNRRRRNRAPQQVGLATALGGRHHGGGLTSLSLRRNIFIQGQDDWPKATSGGLGMEVVERRADGSVEYGFVHSNAYKDVQRQFEACQESMDPGRMVQLLQFNPYHVSTLLVVSQIATHDREHALSSTLVERALFSFGRSVHSTFSRSVTSGLARLSSGHPANGEFHLAAWRYVSSLGMRGTWRTAYEWAKLLLSLNPEGDPYCIRLSLDVLALRAKQAAHYLSLVRNPYFSPDAESATAQETERRAASDGNLETLPNAIYSISLALAQVGDRAAARDALIHAIRTHPWIAARLFSQLNIEPIPPAVWGRSAPTPFDELLMELYVTRAKDLWNTPEATELLFEAATSVKREETTVDVQGDDDEQRMEVPVPVARHVLLTEEPTLIRLLPSSLTAQLTSSMDRFAPGRGTVAPEAGEN